MIPSFRGPVSARVALASSLNVPAVRTLTLVGTESFLNILRQLGIRHLEESGDFYGLSLALGSADMSLWELTNAYRALANGGVWSEAGMMPEHKHPASPPKKVFSPQAAFIVSDILADRDARSDTFGLENPLATRFWTAVKTGTSKDMRDNWCIGYLQPLYGRRLGWKFFRRVHVECERHRRCGAGLERRDESSARTRRRIPSRGARGPHPDKTGQWK